VIAYHKKLVNLDTSSMTTIDGMFFNCSTLIATLVVVYLDVAGVVDCFDYFAYN
jgi:hypothetical protein